MPDFEICAHCGEKTAWSPHRGKGDCLNRDCAWCWYGPEGMSLIGLRALLVLDLSRTEPVFDAVAIPRKMAERLVELLAESPAE